MACVCWRQTAPEVLGVPARSSYRLAELEGHSPPAEPELGDSQETYAPDGAKE